MRILGLVVLGDTDVTSVTQHEERLFGALLRNPCDVELTRFLEMSRLNTHI